MDTSSSCSSRNSMKKVSSSPPDSPIYMWFLQKCALDRPIGGSILQEKALTFRTKLGRHGIRELKIHGEKLSADTSKGQITSHDKQNVYSEESN
ncbi:hypothetical protein T06_8411 [Trichinella sp. T6]|nr:hypothetical protein T06_8411 [Trichinella sp. T6]